MNVLQRRRIERELEARLDEAQRILDALHAAAAPPRSLEAVRAAHRRVLDDPDAEHALAATDDLSRALADIADAVGYDGFRRVARAATGGVPLALLLTRPDRQEVVAEVHAKSAAAETATLQLRRAASDAALLRAHAQEVGEHIEETLERLRTLPLPGVRLALELGWREAHRDVIDLSRTLSDAVARLSRTDADAAALSADWEETRRDAEPRVTALLDRVGALAQETDPLLSRDLLATLARAALALRPLVRGDDTLPARRRACMELAPQLLSHPSTEVRQRLAEATVELAFERWMS